MSEPVEAEASILDVVAGEEPLKFEAEYELESPARCPGCQKRITKIGVLRLIRTRVNFVSTFPRRGYIAVCGECSTILPADLGGVL
jgi:hypothetical protein